MASFIPNGQPLSVLITGASSGIGLALAHEFQTRGHRVFATARRPDALNALRAAGFYALELEVTDASAVERLATTLARDGVALDMLINNAGFGAMGPLLDISRDTLQRQFDVNVFALLSVTQAFAPAMVARRRGRIVNISSVSGVLPTPFAGAYCASKAAVNALSDALRMELAPFGVDVITVQPGGIRSNFGETASEQVTLKPGSLYTAMQAAIAERATLSQTEATPADVFARDMVDAVLADTPPVVVRIGEKSMLMPWLKKWIPESALDRILSRRFALGALR